MNDHTVDPETIDDDAYLIALFAREGRSDADLILKLSATVNNQREQIKQLQEDVAFYRNAVLSSAEHIEEKLKSIRIHCSNIKIRSRGWSLGETEPEDKLP